MMGLLLTTNVKMTEYFIEYNGRFNTYLWIVIDDVKFNK